MALTINDINVGQVVYTKYGDDTTNERVIKEVKEIKGHTVISVYKRRASRGSNFYGNDIFELLVKKA